MYIYWQKLLSAEKEWFDLNITWFACKPMMNDSICKDREPERD